MKRRSLFEQFFLGQALATAIGLGVVGIYFATSIQTFYHDKLMVDLEARSRLVRSILEERVQKSPNSPRVSPLKGLQETIFQLGKESHTRFTVIGTAGQVWADSRADPQKLQLHANRPEIQAALSGRAGTAFRFSKSTSEEQFYYALPIRLESGKVAGVIRSSLSADLPREDVKRMIYRLIAALVVVLLFIGWRSWSQSDRVGRTLESIRNRVMQIAGGDFSKRIAVRLSDSRELDGI